MNTISNIQASLQQAAQRTTDHDQINLICNNSTLFQKDLMIIMIVT